MARKENALMRPLYVVYANRSYEVDSCKFPNRRRCFLSRLIPKKAFHFHKSDRRRRKTAPYPRHTCLVTCFRYRPSLSSSSISSNEKRLCTEVDFFCFDVRKSLLRLCSKPRTHPSINSVWVFGCRGLCEEQSSDTVSPLPFGHA